MNVRRTTSLGLLGLLAIALISAPPPATAEEPTCADALGELEQFLDRGELPANAVIEDIGSQCPNDVREPVENAIASLRIVVLTSQVKRLDASRIESYQRLQTSLGTAGKGKQASTNQAFGVALQTLRPVLAVQLQKKLAQQH
jgi:hypothetical protein